MNGGQSKSFDDCKHFQSTYNQAAAVLSRWPRSAACLEMGLSWYYPPALTWRSPRGGGLSGMGVALCVKI